MAKDIRKEIDELVNIRIANAQQERDYEQIAKSAALVTCVLAAGALTTGVLESNVLCATFSAAGAAYGGFSLYSHCKALHHNLQDKIIGKKITNLVDMLDRDNNDKEM